jgi:hypothetical protein
MKKILLFTLLPGCSYCLAQESIETDRPDQTECASVVEPGKVQLETGFLYIKDEMKHPAGKNRMQAYNYGTSLWRIGVFPRAELRLEVGQYEKTHYKTLAGEHSIEGFSPFVIGTKIAVCEENGIIPQTAFIGHLQLPFGDKKLIIKNEVLPSFCFSMAHTLNKTFSLGYNLGMEWESGSSLPLYFYTGTIGAGIGEQWEVFIESFGNFSAGNFPESYFDLGAGFLPRNNIKLDISGGIAMNENAADLFLSAGISVRLPD